MTLALGDTQATDRIKKLHLQASPASRSRPFHTRAILASGRQEPIRHQRGDLGHRHLITKLQKTLPVGRELFDDGLHVGG